MTVGTVDEVSDWLGSPGTGITVTWHLRRVENNSLVATSTLKYRYGYVDPQTGRRVFDLRVLPAGAASAFQHEVGTATSYTRQAGLLVVEVQEARLAQRGGLFERRHVRVLSVCFDASVGSVAACCGRGCLLWLLLGPWCVYPHIHCVAMSGWGTVSR